MEETIRIRAVDKSDWSSVVEGFDIETIQDVLEVVGADGQKNRTPLRNRRR